MFVPSPRSLLLSPSALFFLPNVSVTLHDFWGHRLLTAWLAHQLAVFGAAVGDGSVAAAPSAGVAAHGLQTKTEESNRNVKELNTRAEGWG